MQGKIIKGIAGFYYVHTGSDVYQCKAKGIFRNRKEKPLVGDDVEIEITCKPDMEGNITRILPRKNKLIRPEVANVDQALVIFAFSEPKPNYNLLNRFLMMMDKQDVPTVICFNKSDLSKREDRIELTEVYKRCGHQILFSSVNLEEGIQEILHVMEGKTTVFAGPSGVGKSSLMNLIQPDVHMEVGKVSEKIGRGKHTTRHSQLVRIKERTFVLDTPGFSSLFLSMFEADEVKDYFHEFEPYEGTCRFQGCSHTHEPGCSVKKAMEEGAVSKIRYDSYVEIYQQLKEKGKY